MWNPSHVLSTIRRKYGKTKYVAILISLVKRSWTFSISIFLFKCMTHTHPIQQLLELIVSGYIRSVQ
jgi:hypothetical protein